MRVAVTDTGIGIKVNDQERVFKEFEQADSSYGRQQEGTGLGLALTKRLVEMHGGRIWVESEGVEGKGSTFTFLIPISKAEAGFSEDGNGRLAFSLLGQEAIAPERMSSRLADAIRQSDKTTGKELTELERLGALSNEPPGTGGSL